MASKHLVTKVNLFGRQVFIKRDDLHFDLSGTINGNKARKFDFIISRKLKETAIASYGGIQSNSMLALAKIAKVKGVDFHYFCKGVPKHLKRDPIGNYKQSIDAGMKVHEVSAAFYNKIASWGAEGFNGSILQDVMLTELPSNECFWIAQGGAMPIAEEGVVKLANEIEAFIDQCSNQFPWKVIVCCGTGCTSYFLSKYFADQRELHARDVEVIAVPCVSTEEQLIEQIQQLHKICGYDQILSTPTVLSTKSAPTRIFAQPCSTHMNIW
eukprot:CAMPEP_0174995236 /NCGR_PEP_ID=MMETSP0004_2-20121128/24072_1 /TAXON_ID=420556 /ORGANISM="Ochromonas sp., Strain CCMP1393" /LENGTH=268 /DNA_ID=CAMNT_0016249547 /DNA_START=29 /DNA_END=832 /DNA_ORIENTATION=-